MGIRHILFVAAVVAFGPGSQATEPPQVFSKIGRWTIFRYPDRCAALNKDFADVLSMSVREGHPMLTLINDHLDMPAGDYPIGVKISMPSSAAPREVTLTGKVLPEKGKAIVFNLKRYEDLETAASADWIEFSLGGHKHMVNMQQGTDALRALPICEKNAADPFAERK